MTWDRIAFVVCLAIALSFYFYNVYGFLRVTEDESEQKVARVGGMSPDTSRTQQRSHRGRSSSWRKTR
jgi:hypothetical protein